MGMVPMWYWHLWSQNVFTTGAGLKEAQREDQSPYLEASEKKTRIQGPQPPGQRVSSGLNGLDEPASLKMIPWLSASPLIASHGPGANEGDPGKWTQELGSQERLPVWTSILKNTLGSCACSLRSSSQEVLHITGAAKARFLDLQQGHCPSHPGKRWVYSRLGETRGLWTRKRQAQVKAGIPYWKQES